MSDISVRIAGAAGRITLQRPKALNAVTYQMVKTIHRALEDWRSNTEVKLVVIDAEGEKAFSAGGDIADLYESGQRKDYAYGQRFWADEYRMNAALYTYEKKVISFLQGFTMGGGMGVGCHGSHRIVGERSQIAMPECGIGLVPDVGGSLYLANAPGYTGAYLGTTGARMCASDAIFAGFADMFIPEVEWPALISQLELTGSDEPLKAAAQTPPNGTLDSAQEEISQHFSSLSLAEVEASLAASETEFATQTLKAFRRASPLSAQATLLMMDRLKGNKNIRDALRQEYRFTARAVERSDFLEGIRAAIIDKDRNPTWRHDISTITHAEAEAMLAPLEELELAF